MQPVAAAVVAVGCLPEARVAVEARGRTRTGRWNAWRRRGARWPETLQADADGVTERAVVETPLVDADKAEECRAGQTVVDRMPLRVALPMVVAAAGDVDARRRI